MKPLSFRLKIAFWSTLTSGLVLAGFGTGAWMLIHHQRLDSVDRELRSISARHPGWILNRPNPERLTSMLEFTFGEDRKTNVILQITAPPDGLIYQSPHWPEGLEIAEAFPGTNNLQTAASETDTTHGSESRHSRPGGAGRGGMGKGGYGPGRGPGAISFIDSPRFFTATAKGSAWRIGVFRTEDATIIFGMNFDEIRGELNHLRNRFLFALPLALACIGAGGWLVAGRALRPLKSIAETAEAVTARGLDQRIPVSKEDPEIARVIEVLNRMMDRLEKSFRQATRFSADASHELKTPLTIMQGELENALQSAPAGSQQQQVFGNLLEETHRLKSIIQSLLLLAQADAGHLKLNREQVGLASLIEEVLEDAQVLAADRQLRFDTKLVSPASVSVDRALFQTALLNLLSNAVKYNEKAGRVTLELRNENGNFLLEVGNTGPGISGETQHRLFERFHRGDTSRSRGIDGMGLGLSLAREIVRAHGGEVRLKETRPGWTVFELSLHVS